MKKIKICAATFTGHCANGVEMSRIPLRATAFFALKPYGADGHDHSRSSLGLDSLNGLAEHPS